MQASADQLTSTSRTASAKACGASLRCGRTWPERGARHPPGRGKSRGREPARLSGEDARGALRGAHHRIQHLARSRTGGGRSARRSFHADRGDDRLGRGHGDVTYMPELLRVKGRLFLSMPQPNSREAEMCFRQSLDLSRRNAVVRTRTTRARPGASAAGGRAVRGGLGYGRSEGCRTPADDSGIV